MWVVANFTEVGVPKTGLTPTIRIRDVATSALEITDVNMSEVGDGWYKYFFTAYDPLEEYIARCDGGATLADTERYTWGGNDSFVDDISENVWNLPADSHVEPGSFGELTNQASEDIIAALGLTNHNKYVDQPVYDENCNLISARVRLYSDAESIGTSNDVLNTYLVTSDPDGRGKFKIWQQTEVDQDAILEWENGDLFIFEDGHKLAFN